MTLVLPRPGECMGVLNCYYRWLGSPSDADPNFSLMPLDWGTSSVDSWGLLIIWTDL